MSGSRATVRQRLRRLVLLLVGLMTLAVVAGSISVLGAYQNQQTLTRINGPAADANSALLQTLTDAETGLRGYQASSDPIMLEPFDGAQQRSDSQRAALRSALRPQLTKWSARLAAQDAAVANWWRWANDSRSRLTAGDRVDLVAGKRLFDSVRTANQALGGQLQAQRLAARERSVQRLRRSLVLLLGAGVIAAAIALYAGWRIARSLSDSIGGLRSTMRAQRAGDREIHADTTRGPLDIRELAADFNHLTDSTRSMERAQQHSLEMHEMTLALAGRLRQRVSSDEALGITAEVLGCATGTTAAVFTTTPGTGGAERTWRLAACWPDRLDESRTVMAPPVSQDSIARRLWLAGRLLESSDLAKDDELRHQPFVASVCDQLQVGALLGTPLGVGEEVFGAMLLISGEPREWTSDERSALLQATAYTAQAFLAAEQHARQTEHVARLESLDRQKDDFVATVSHELRTPLTSVAGYLEMLEDGDLGELSASQRKALDVIGRNTTRLRGLIEDVLVLNRIESRTLDPSFRPVDLAAAVRDVVQDLQPQAATNGVTLQAQDFPDDCVVEGDAAQLGRALTNVIGNAVKFTPAGGTVTLSAVLEATRIRISCRDTGIGIPAADLERMFSRFFRASNATERTIPGTGLGLAIVKAIVEAHHGVVELHSVENQGTTFVIDLPRAQAPGQR